MGRLQELLRSKREAIASIAPDLDIYVEGIGKKFSAKVIDALKEKFQTHKKREFKVVDLISINSAEPSIAAEKIETQGVCEQIILYNLYKRFENRSFNNKERETFLALFSELGSYSFEWMNFESKKLLGMLEKTPFDSAEHDKIYDQLCIINDRLAQIFWGVGYLQAAITQMEMLRILKINNLENRFTEKMEGLQAIGLSNTICARQLLANPYSEKILGMLVIDKDIKNLLSEGPTRDLIPSTNEEAIKLLETSISAQLKNKGFPTEIVEKPALLQVEKLNTLVSNTSQTFYYSSSESKESRQNTVKDSADNRISNTKQQQK